MKVNISHNYSGPVSSVVIAAAAQFDGVYDTEKLAPKIAEIRAEVEADAADLELADESSILVECVQRIVARDFAAEAGQSTGADVMCFSGQKCS